LNIQKKTAFTFRRLEGISIQRVTLKVFVQSLNTRHLISQRQTSGKKKANFSLVVYISSISNYVGRRHTHQHLFLQKNYSGSPTASIYTPWTEAEVLSHLETGWGEGAITELKLEYLYGPSPQIMYQFLIEFLGRAFSYSGFGILYFEGLVALERATAIDQIMPIAETDTGQ
jgi:hypothetical protein